jgi:redox-sensitive bicupin YhaK (pirin superfamily)
MSNVEIVIQPKVKDLGDNFEVRRSLPNIKKRMVGPFIFWDHMGPVTLAGEKEMKVRAHPHIGLATITWLFSGQIMHRDNLGNEQMIRPGEVNWMTAGKGIAHSERSRADEGESLELEGIQLWLALPKESEEVSASFFHCKPKDLPNLMHGQSELTLVAGSWGDARSPVPVYSELFYLNGRAPKSETFKATLKAGHEGAIYIIEGKLEVEGQEYERFDLIAFKKDAPIEFKVLEDAQFMLFGGEVFAEKRHIWWNFVSTDQARIEQAKRDWKDGKFAAVINEEEYIPLPSD